MRELRPSERDLRVIQLVQGLGFATAAHIQPLLFDGLSKKPLERCLARLTRLGYLDRVERRPRGGSRAGSCFYIYRLGRRGWWLLNDQPFKARRQAIEHSLAVADVVVILRALEQQGLHINAVLTEPDCHDRVAGVDLKPDLFVDLQRGGNLKLWVEMDMATQGRKRILSKFGMYLRAVQRAADDEVARYGGALPLVLFIAVDDERRRELLYFIDELDEDDRRIFRVTTRADLTGLLTG